MIEVLSPQQMKNIDECAITKLATPSLQLMERAGTALLAETAKRIPLRKSRIAVVCGKGNNGGDGFVAARVASEAGAHVTVLMTDAVTNLSDDARAMYDQLRKADITVSGMEAMTQRNTGRFDAVIDAVFGTSFRGAAAGKYLDAIRWINRFNRKAVVAADIPSGLDGETGIVGSEAVRAGLTVTFSNPKTGFYLHQAKDYTGDVAVADIGIPEAALATETSGIFLTEPSDCRSLMPIRSSDSHKHSVGKIFLLAGSRGMMGAALMSSQAAMRSGAGQAIMGIPETEYTVAARRTLEVMPLPLAATPEGTVSRRAQSDIETRMRWSDVCIIGCGLSQNDETKSLIRSVIASCPRPMVIDADALNALADDLSLLQERISKEVVLTPHYGEFSRMTGIPAERIGRERFEIARTFAQLNDVVLVLKGAPTVVAVPEGGVFINPTGNPGMATAGAGDVLSGIIGALMGQRLSASAAAVLGAYLHGRAGDDAAERKGMHGMIAGDIIASIPKIMKGMAA